MLQKDKVTLSSVVLEGVSNTVTVTGNVAITGTLTVGGVAVAAQTNPSFASLAFFWNGAAPPAVNTKVYFDKSFSLGDATARPATDDILLSGSHTWRCTCGVSCTFVTTTSNPRITVNLRVNNVLNTNPDQSVSPQGSTNTMQPSMSPQAVVYFQTISGTPKVVDCYTTFASGTGQWDRNVMECTALN